MGIRGASRPDLGGHERPTVGDDVGTDRDHRIPALDGGIAGNLRRGGPHPRRLLAAAGTAMVAVAAIAGGSVAFSSTTTPSPSRDTQSGPPPRAGGASTPPRGLLASGAGGSDGGTSPSSAGSGVLACPMIPAAAGAAGAIGATDTVGSASHLFTRTTPDGVTIRTYRLSRLGACTRGPVPVGSSASSASGASSGAASSEPPVVSDGLPVTQPLSVELSDDAAVGQGELFDAPSTSSTTRDPGVE